MKKSLFERCIEIEKDLLTEHGSTMAKILIDGPKGIIVMALVFTNEKEKDTIRKKVKEYMLANDIEEYVFSSECWVSKRQQGSSFHKAPRRDVNKRQALVINLFRKDKENLTKIFEFDKEGDKITFGEEQSLKGATGIWDIWADEDKFNQQMKEEIKKNDEQVLIKMAMVLRDEFGDEFNAQTTEEGKMAVMKKVEERILQMFEEERKKILEDPEDENER